MLMVSHDFPFVHNEEQVVATFLHGEVCSSFQEVSLNGQQNFKFNEMSDDVFCGVHVYKS